MRRIVAVLGLCAVGLWPAVVTTAQSHQRQASIGPAGGKLPAPCAIAIDITPGRTVKPVRQHCEQDGAVFLAVRNTDQNPHTVQVSQTMTDPNGNSVKVLNKDLQAKAAAGATGYDDTTIVKTTAPNRYTYVVLVDGTKVDPDLDVAPPSMPQVPPQKKKQ